MLVARPIRMEDHAEMLNLARAAGIGMTSLPPDEGVLEQKIARAVVSFAGRPAYPQGDAFLFALEDTQTGAIVGSAGLVAHVGILRPFYSYKLSTIVQASERVQVYSLNRVLHMVNDYTGATELGSLFLLPDYRKDGIGRFLSRCRHLMLAEHSNLFSDTVISEIRGIQNIHGESPFYKHLAKHFFSMEFRDADFTYATQGGQFIADLMPRYPIYVKMLPTEAQEVIGQPHAASLPAKRMLEYEGFTHEGYVDIFDAGPTMQCELSQIRTVRQSRKLPLIEIRDASEGTPTMVANVELAEFRMARAPMLKTADGVILDAECARALHLSVGDNVRFAV